MYSIGPRQHASPSRVFCCALHPAFGALVLLLHLVPCRFHFVRMILNNIRWSLMDNKYAGEWRILAVW